MKLRNHVDEQAYKTHQIFSSTLAQFQMDQQEEDEQRFLDSVASQEHEHRRIDDPPVAALLQGMEIR
jgi:hypothetical protein